MLVQIALGGEENTVAGRPFRSVGDNCLHFLSITEKSPLKHCQHYRTENPTTGFVGRKLCVRVGLFVT